MRPLLECKFLRVSDEFLFRNPQSWFLKSNQAAKYPKCINHLAEGVRSCVGPADRPRALQARARARQVSKHPHQAAWHSSRHVHPEHSLLDDLARGSELLLALRHQDLDGLQRSAEQCRRQSGGDGRRGDLMSVPTGTPLKIPIQKVLVNTGTDGPNCLSFTRLAHACPKSITLFSKNVKESQRARRVAGITIGSRKLWCFNPNRPASRRTVSYPR